MLALNLVSRLAEIGLRTGARHQWNMFDPATLRNAPVEVTVGAREVVRAANLPVPAFRVEMEFSGLRTTSWITDTGEVIREESPARVHHGSRDADRAQALAVPGQIRQDLLELSAIVPEMAPACHRLAIRVTSVACACGLSGVDLSSPDLSGRWPARRPEHRRNHRCEPLLATVIGDHDLSSYLTAEPFIESDDPDIRAAAEEAVRGVRGAKSRAEALTRYVSSILQKKPTVSLPSAREVLRTKIGDCNEHTVALRRPRAIAGNSVAELRLD